MPVETKPVPSSTAPSPAAPSPPPKAAPAPATTTTAPPAQKGPPAPAAAFERLKANLHNFAEGKPTTKGEPRPPTPTPESDPDGFEEPTQNPAPDPQPSLEGMDDADLPSAPAKSDPPPQVEQARADGKKEKVSPWRLVDQWKGRALELEKQIADLKTGSVPDADRKVFEEKISTYEKRLKELDDHMVLTDYRQSNEFKEKYEKPYFEAYADARKRVASMKTESGEKASEEVFDSLIGIMDDDEAANAIENIFGNGAKAASILQMRERVMELSRAAQTHLKEQTAEGATKLRALAESRHKAVKDTQDYVAKVWDASNRAFQDDPKMGHAFRQREGDPEWNQRLAKGFELTDKAFSQNAFDPALTQEQRAAVVRRHAAVRNRAAAFGALMHEVNRMTMRISELTSELEQYRGSDPGRGDGNGRHESGEAPPSSNPWDRLNTGLRKLTS